MTIRIINEDNISFIKRDNVMYDFIYADMIYENLNLEWINHAISRMKDRCIFVVQTDYHTVCEVKRHLDMLGMSFVNWLIYINDWGGVPKNRFAQKHDDILVYSNSTTWKWNSDSILIPKATAGTKFDKKGTGTKVPASVFYDKVSFSTVSKERVKTDSGRNIQWQKPLWLMERLLLPFTDEGDNVLDLFMGSGTLGEVCRYSNRNYTGIEIDKNVFSLAEKRLNVS
jgi:DNA modification methylase